ncbi:MAG: NAD(P)-dependent alcohol dehydrogenase [bacterium]|nr:NAD(P)-dependent alcohol dehydrogenase [bacterium]
MKAIVYTEYGTPGVLQLKEVEKPAIKDNEVLINVHAASINSWDGDLLRGSPFIVRLVGGGIRKPKLNILGIDIAGKVEEVGKNVKRLKPGDDVFGDISGCGFGGFAEYVAAREDILALKPAGMTFEEAATISHTAVLALQGLRNKREIQPGQRILFNGSGGGVGTFGLQIAKSFGAEVTCVDNTGKLDKLRSLGADHVIDYTKDDFTKNDERYDLVLDVVGNRSIFDYKRALSPTGRYVMIGGGTPLILQAMLLGPLISITGSKKMGVLPHQPKKEDLEFMTELFEAGKVVPVIDKRFPLSETADAFRYYEEGRFIGKIVITMEDYT